MQVFFSNIFLISVIFLTGYFLFYIPGKVINDVLLGNKYDFIISFSVGFSTFTFFSFFIYSFNLKITYSIILYLLINSFFLFFFKKIKYKKKTYKNISTFEKIIYQLAILAFVILLFSINPIYLSNAGSDMWYYLAIVRSFIDDGYLSNISPWFNDLQSSYPSNSFFLYLTIISHLLPNSSLLDIFRIVGVYLTALSIVINVLVLNFFIKNLTYSFAIISLIFISSYFLGDNLIFLMSNYPYYPKIFSTMIFVPVLIYIFFTRIFEKKLFIIFFTLILVTYINQSSINLIISTFVIIVFLISEKNFHIIKMKAINLCIPLLFATLFFYFHLSDFYFTQTGVISNYSDNLLINAREKGPYYGHIIEIFENLFIYSPIKYFSELYYHYLLLILLTLFFFKLLKNQKIIIYFYLMLLFSILIVFNPISILIINKIMPTFFLVRLNWIFLGYIFLGLLIGIIINNFKFKKKFYEFLLIMSTICFCILSTIYYKKGDIIYTNSLKAVEKKIRDIEKNSFIVTDRFSSNKLLAFKKIKFLISHENWLKFTTPEQNFKRYYNIYDSGDLFLNENIFEYLNHIQADYLFVDKSITKNYKIINKNNNLKILFDDHFFLLIEI